MGISNVAKKSLILIVDDDLEYAEIVKKYLCDIYNVEIVSSGKQALNYLFFNEVDLVLLDIEMPEVDGFKTYDGIRDLDKGNEIPIIFSTGVRNKATILKTVSKGAEGYFVKPTSKSLILEKVEEVLKKSNELKNRKKILVIDDDVEFLTIIKNYLRDIYIVNIVNNYNLAMEYLSKNNPDLLLLDYEMPIYNGLSLLGLIRGKQRLKDLPVIMVSGNTDTSVITNLCKYNIKDYVKKPVNKEVLLEKINKVIKDSE